MDFFNKGMAQIADLFRSMTPAARITAGLLLAVVLVSLTYLFNHEFSGGDAYLLGGQSFTSAELSAMEAAFGKAGLSTYNIDGGRVQVPSGQKSVYLAALADNGALPAHFGDHMNSALNFGPFETRDQRDAKIKAAKERELAGIILSMQGIEKASVQFDVEKQSGFRQTAGAKASVAVKRHGVLPLDEKQVPMIRHLIAGAFAGLSPEHVTIIDLNGRTYSGSTVDGMGSASEDPFVSRTREFQAMYESQIYKALSYVPGVTVTANVELNKELRQHQEKDSYDPKGVVPVMIKEETHSDNSKAGSPGGRPGLEAQSPNQGARLPTVAAGNESTEESSSNETQNLPSRERVSTELAGLTPKRVSVSVGIPSSYFEHVWRQRNPTPAGQEVKAPDKAALDLIQKEETDKIRSYVTNIVPAPPDTADQAAQLVTVTTFEHVITETDSGPPITERAFAWLSGSWTTLGTIGLVIMSLMMLRSIMNSPATAVPEMPRLAAQTAADTLPEAAPAAEANKPKGRFKRKLGSGPPLRDELAEMVREDPDAAANILRGWIGQTN